MDLCYSCLMAHPANPLIRSNPFNHLVSSDWRSILQLSDMSNRVYEQKGLDREIYLTKIAKHNLFCIHIIYGHHQCVYSCTLHRTEMKILSSFTCETFYPNYKKYQIYFQNLHFFGNLLNILSKFESKLEKNVNWEKYFLKFK